MGLGKRRERKRASGRAGPAGSWERRPSGPSSACPAGWLRALFEAAVLGKRRAAPCAGGLHGCSAITQAQVWAQSGRGGGLAGKARAAALACAARVGPGLFCTAGRARCPPLGVWGCPGPAGAPRTPVSQDPGWGRGGPGAPAGGWAAGPRWPDVRLWGSPLGTGALIGP